MAIYTCKMCGGQLKAEPGTSICTCDFCSTRQTLPLIDDEQAALMINRAHHFRQLGDFDKAADTYTRLIAADDGNGADPDLYWSLVLCRYGIEYVNDPVTRRWIATCHRMQYRSISDDPDYQKAVNKADPLRRMYYEQEAEYIAQIQKRILEISEREEPFDIFLCYKETDTEGNRTQDSVLAQEMYYQLMKEGFKVFFSRITLEGKLGTEYEPYIFAALHSAKTMVVIGTDPAYFDAVWVRNEWSRYLSIMQEEGMRSLIVAYKDMNPYDIPDALSMYPAQDMGKLGFLQDLVRGIRKLAHKEEELADRGRARETIVITENSNVDPLLKRVEMFLEDDDFASAAEYCEKALDILPECSKAYLYLVMARYKYKTVERFEQEGLTERVVADPDFRRMIRFGDEATRARYNDLFYSKLYEESVKCQTWLETIEITGGEVKAEEWLALNQNYRNLNGYMDSAQRGAHVKEKAEEKGIAELKEELQGLILPSEYRAFYNKRGEIENLLGRSRILEAFGSADPKVVYEKAKSAQSFNESSRSLIEAAWMFAVLGDYNDSYDRMIESATLAIYTEASQKMERNDRISLSEAAQAFELLKDYRDSKERAADCRGKWKKETYAEAERWYENATTNQDFDRAADLYSYLGDYLDAAEKLRKCRLRIKPINAPHYISEYKVDDHPVRDTLVGLLNASEYEYVDDGLLGLLFGRRRKK